MQNLTDRVPRISDRVKANTDGLSQTIDFWDKRSANTSIGEITLYASQQHLLNLIDSKKANALIALTNWQSAKDVAQLSTERESQLQTLLSIVEDKQKPLCLIKL